jgi:sulfur carrier protein ThiS
MVAELRRRAAPEPCDDGTACLGSGCSHQRAADELVRLGQDNPTDEQPVGIRGLLEHVGIDARGKTITVNGKPIKEDGR